MHIALNAWQGLYEVEIEPEVRSWLAGLPTATSAASTSSSDCLLSTPKISASLTPATWEGRSGNCGTTVLRQQTRVTYWLVPGRRVILLTVFPKTRSAETAEVARALHAQKICEAEHGPAHQVSGREVN